MIETRKERISVAVNDQTKATYEKLAKAGNHTMSKAVGDFLQMMEPYADFLAEEYAQAQSRPKEAIKNATDLIERVKWQMRVEKQSSKGGWSKFETEYLGQDPKDFN